MGENSSIGWTDHTFNPWIGCQKISPACDNCYAETWDNRFNGGRWGTHAVRTRTSQANWRKPYKWHRAAGDAGESVRVFCASLADVFDNDSSIPKLWRDDLWRMIEDTYWLDWLLLTKRPQNIMKAIGNRLGEEGHDFSNAWFGITSENQKELDRRWHHLALVMADIRVNTPVSFISAEPLLEQINIPNDVGWVIAGCESGPNARQSDPDWFRSLRDQCADRDIPFFLKQVMIDGKLVTEPKLDGDRHLEIPKAGQFIAAEEAKPARLNRKEPGHE